MGQRDTDAHVDGDLEDLLAFIRDSRGFDFTGYKRTTLGRRIWKRMGDVGIDSYVGYRDLLESSADEFGHLFNTILINVTSFLRDSEAWSYLQSEILPDLIATTDPDAEIRVWSAGCASGEEAYSLAIVFSEVLGIDECLERVKIYGTDVDEEALRDARSGLYPAKALEALPEDLCEKYFERNGAQFVFRPDLRRKVIFGRHDITRDAPISRLDLLVCRNTLMYFNFEAQSQIIDRFHFALRDGGYLFLGKAEMLLSDGDRFENVDMRQRVFRCRPAEAAEHQTAPVRPEAGTGGALREVSRQRRVRDLALESLPYAALGVDADGDVVLANAQMRTMFGMSSRDVGRPFRDLEISYRPVELRSLIEQAYAERRTIRANAVERTLGIDQVQYLDIVIQPLSSSDGTSVVGAIITVIDTTAATRLQLEVKHNREELENAYEELQSTNEELETTNEELQSSIEELETTNEELQSTNEELETTNEELQSGNEELETMNEELRVRTDELDEARGFLEGVLSSVAAGLVVLDAELKVRSWNRGAQDMWGLRSDEVQMQSFFDLDFGLPTQGLRGLVQECLGAGRRTGPVQIEAINRLGRPVVCAVQCSPLETAVDGVVLLIEES